MTWPWSKNKKQDPPKSSAERKKEQDAARQEAQAEFWEVDKKIQEAKNRQRAPSNSPPTEKK